MKKYVDGVLVDATEDEIKARQKEEADWVAGADTRLAEKHRTTRNNLIVKTDWTQGRDVVLSNDATWKTYRQALRDLPTHSNWPDLKDSDWPTKPS